MDDARAIALRQVPGILVDAELDSERGGWIYEFEIRPDGGDSRSKYEVRIDGDSGAVISVDDD